MGATPGHQDKQEEDSCPSRRAKDSCPSPGLTVYDGRRSMGISVTMEGSL